MTNVGCKLSSSPIKTPGPQNLKIEFSSHRNLAASNWLKIIPENLLEFSQFHVYDSTNLSIWVGLEHILIAGATGHQDLLTINSLSATVAFATICRPIWLYYNQ